MQISKWLERGYPHNESLHVSHETMYRMRLCTATDIFVTNHGTVARAAGLLINRQRPSTATEVIFLTLEVETGQISLVVWPRVGERQRRVVLQPRRLLASGTVDCDGEVVHLIAGRLEDHSRLLGKLKTNSQESK